MTAKDNDAGPILQRFPSASPRPRESGIALMRGLAAFGVVFIHSGLVFRGKVTPGVTLIQNVFSAFAVPFFIAAAIYFAAREIKDRPNSLWFNRRFTRLIWPYALWTVLYGGARLLQDRLSHHPETQALPDLLSALLFGTTGVALYFLPLILVGFIALWITSGPIFRAPIGALFIGTVISLAVAQVSSRSGNGFDMSYGTAFVPALNDFFGPEQAIYIRSLPSFRIGAVFLAHLIRCAPYIFATAILLHDFSSTDPKKHPLWMIFWIAIATAGLFSNTIPEALVGISFFVLASKMGEFLPAPISSFGLWIGTYSFGIYLCHQFVLQGLQWLVQNGIHLPAALPLVFGVSLAAFIISISLLHLLHLTGAAHLKSACGIS